jgi:hypothetical protein
MIYVYFVYKKYLDNCEFFFIIFKLIKKLKFSINLIIECSHNPMNQNGHHILMKNSQNWINIYVLSFKAMEIMASFFFFFFHMYVKEFKPKIHLLKF